MRAVFESIRIGGLDLPNRLVMAPVKTGFGDMSGEVTDRLIAYYRRRAEGGVGAVIVEPLYVDPAGKEHPRQLGIEAEAKVVGLRRLVEAIHAGGARAFAHLNHAGRAANTKASGRPPEAPSELVCPTTGATARAMTEERIEELVRVFAAAARRAREAGFDAVELQSGLGYLLAQFISPRTNLRTDAYGGDPKRRERFARAVVAAVREAIGGAMPLTARISASEQVEGGLDLEAGRRLASRLVAWGVDAIHVASGSACDSPPWYYQHMSLPQRFNEELAGEIRKGLGAPVIAAGRLGDPEHLRQVLASGQADLVALGRPLVADPDLPRKLEQGRAEQVMICGSCLQGCLAGVKSGAGLACIVNPEVGHEAEPEARAPRPRAVVVVGGGPAGMTAATVAARRGHSVTLLERAELGGQFALAPLAPGKQAMQKTLSSMIRIARDAGAEIRCGVEADLEQVMALDPEVVVLATGAAPVMPSIPGLEGALTGELVLTGKASTGQRVLVIGGGLVGIEVAEHLADLGREVTVVELLEEIARDMEPITRKLTLKRLASGAIEILTGVTVQRLDGELALVSDASGERDLGPFDSVVAAVGTRPVRTLLEPLVGRGVELHVVGDAEAPDQVLGAVRSAWEVARRL